MAVWLFTAGAWVAAGRLAHLEAQDREVCAGVRLSAAQGQGIDVHPRPAQSLLALDSASRELA